MKITKTEARRIVREIIKDLSDRRGLSHEWNCIDDDVRKEIIAEWVRIAMGGSAK